MTAIIQVTTSQDAESFINLPYVLYRGDAHWVPPIRKAERRLFDPAQNPAYRFCEVSRWVALDDDGKCRGRVAAIVNHRWNDKTGSKTGRISRFEAEDDPVLAHCLLQAAELWLRARGMEYAAGPLGFSNLDQQGLTVMGFDRMAALGSSLTKPYYVEMFRHEGYEPLQDWNEYRLTVPFTVPPKVKAITDAARGRFGLRLRTFSSLDEVKKAAPALMSLFDKNFEPLFGTYPFDEEMKQYYTSMFLDILDHRLVVAVNDEQAGGKPVGFIVAMPSVVKPLRRAWGDIGLMDATGVWMAMRRATEAEILLAAVSPEARMRGAFSLLIECLIERMSARGIRHVETTAILSNNDRAASIVKEFTHERHKQKMCFIKGI